MNIYLLRQDRRGRRDEAQGFVVAAEDEAQARVLAAGSAGDEGPDAWHQSASCVRVGEAVTGMRPDILLESFLPG